MRSLVRALMLALPLVLTWAPPAYASTEWCSGDPPLLLTTPHGATFVIYTGAAGYGMRYLPDVLLATNSYTASTYVRDQAGNLGTTFTITVTVPRDPLAGEFPVLAYVSSGPGLIGALMVSDPAGSAAVQYAVTTGVVYAAAVGSSGAPVQLTFQYPVP